MIAASAMLLFAQSVTPCTTAGTPRLGGGAVMVRPVTGSAAVPFVLLGPATSIRAKRQGIQQTSATTSTEDRTAQQCEGAISIA